MRGGVGYEPLAKVIKPSSGKLPEASRIVFVLFGL